jgi:hypothetical protein
MWHGRFYAMKISTHIELDNGINHLQMRTLGSADEDIIVSDLRS